MNDTVIMLRGEVSAGIHFVGSGSGEFSITNMSVALLVYDGKA